MNYQNKTDVNQVKQQIQQAEANKLQASGSANAMDVEFGNEMDINQIKQQINKQKQIKICFWSFCKRKQFKIIIISNRQSFLPVFLFELFLNE